VWQSSMHSCPHCRARSISSLQKLNGSAWRPIRCSKCGGLAFLSGWGLATLYVAFQIPVLVVILIAIALQSWIGLLLFPVLVAAFLLAVEALVPLKPVSAGAATRARWTATLGLLAIVVAALIAICQLVGKR